MAISNDRLGHVPQPPADLLVQRHQPGPDVHDEQDDVRLFDADGDLPFDLGRQVVGILDADAAGVDQLEIPALGLDERGNAVPGDPGGRVDDADPPPGQAVEQRRFADVRPADNGDERDSHRYLRNRSSRRASTSILGRWASGYSAKAIRKGIRRRSRRFGGTADPVRLTICSKAACGVAIGETMARCDQGYLCEVCGRDVEAITESDLYLRYVLGEVPIFQSAPTPGTARSLQPGRGAIHCRSGFRADRLRWAV